MVHYVSLKYDYIVRLRIASLEMLRFGNVCEYIRGIIFRLRIASNLSTSSQKDNSAFNSATKTHRPHTVGVKLRPKSLTYSNRAPGGGRWRMLVLAQRSRSVDVFAGGSGVQTP